jgi:hypothetical protein
LGASVAIVVLGASVAIVVLGALVVDFSVWVVLVVGLWAFVSLVVQLVSPAVFVAEIGAFVAVFLTHVVGCEICSTKNDTSTQSAKRHLHS